MALAPARPGSTLRPLERILPDRLTGSRELLSLSEPQRRLLSRIQGRTYANLMMTVESALPPSAEALRPHPSFQELEQAAASVTPGGYLFSGPGSGFPEALAALTPWARRALALHNAVAAERRGSLTGPRDPSLSEIAWRVLTGHARTAADSLNHLARAWLLEDRDCSALQGSRALDEFIGLLAALDGLLRRQAAADAGCLAAASPVPPRGADFAILASVTLQAYRDQFIRAGAEHRAFVEALRAVAGEAAAQRLARALEALG